MVFYVFFACCCISMYCIIYSSNTFFYQYQLMILILLLSFLRMLAMLILVLIKRGLCQAHIFECTCCKNFQIHLQMSMCYFERINHDTCLSLVARVFFGHTGICTGIGTLTEVLKSAPTDRQIDTSYGSI